MSKACGVGGTVCVPRPSWAEVALARAVRGPYQVPPSSTPPRRAARHPCVRRSRGRPRETVTSSGGDLLDQRRGVALIEAVQRYGRAMVTPRRVELGRNVATSNTGRRRIRSTMRWGTLEAGRIEDPVHILKDHQHRPLLRRAVELPNQSLQLSPRCCGLMSCNGCRSQRRRWDNRSEISLMSLQAPVDRAREERGQLGEPCRWRVVAGERGGTFKLLDDRKEARCRYDVASRNGSSACAVRPRSVRASRESRAICRTPPRPKAGQPGLFPPGPAPTAEQDLDLMLAAKIRVRAARWSDLERCWTALGRRTSYARTGSGKPLTQRYRDRGIRRVAEEFTRSCGPMHDRVGLRSACSRRPGWASRR